jgi:asparagine synthase (glutamine-hydrolysing)
VCGVFGAVNLSPECGDIAAGDLEPMARALAHRGPDGAAMESFGWAAIGMTRLGIVAPEEPARVYGARGRCRAVLNGEIYNHQALRRLVRAGGEEPESATDTALIPSLYALFGDDLTARLRGPYAIALVDCRRRTLHLWRSPLGEKPLYTARHRGRLYFASEVKALIAVGAVRVTVRPRAAARFLWRGVLDEDEPLLEGVQPLPPGTHLRVSARGVASRQFWAATEAAHRRPVASPPLVERLAHVFEEGVRLRARAEVPAALLLSGGVDSSLVGAAARRWLDRVYTIAVPGADESARARRVAGALRLPWQPVPAPPPTVERLARALWHLEVPDAHSAFGMAAAFEALAEVMHGDGIRVALSGEGADEIFLGYAWDAAMAALDHGWSLAPQSEARRALGARVQLLLGITRIGLRGGGEPVRPRDVWLAAVDGDLRRLVEEEGLALLRPEVRRRLGRCYSFRDSAGLGPPGRIEARGLLPARLRQIFGLRHDMLTLPVLHADRLLMAHGVEARMPFLDLELVELALRAPAELLEQPGIDKPVLRQLARRLLGTRARVPRKRGFTASPLPDAGGVLRLARSLCRDPGLAVDTAALALWERAVRQRRDPVRLKLLWRAALLELTLRVMREGPGLAGDRS